MVKKKKNSKRTFNIDGTIFLLPSGKGLFKPDDVSVDEIIISRHFLNGSFDSDRVRVQPFYSNYLNQSKGKVVKILKRFSSNFIAIIYKKKDTWYANVDINQPKNIRIEDTKISLKQFDIVEITMVNWNAGRRRAIARIIKIVCHHNDVKADLKFVTGKYRINDSLTINKKNLEENIFKEKINASVKRRKDLRSLETFTIDPIDARDFDDAISIEYDKSRLFIWVHIADVAEFVDYNSQIDKEAMLRGNSYYFPERVYHMLPRILSTKYCSLEPNVDRLSLSIKMNVDEKYNVTDYEIHETVINSDKKFSYEEAGSILDKNEESDHTTSLHLLDKITDDWKRKRIQKGGFEINTSEWKYDFDDEGIPTKYFRKKTNKSHKIIEECMLMANKIAAIYMKDKLDDRFNHMIFRNHDIPSLVNEQRIRKIFNRFKFNPESKHEAISSKDIHRFLLDIKDQSLKKFLSISILKKMKKANYGLNSIGHFGLGFNLYTHFTSPIRRYSDLVIHRQIKGILRKIQKSKIQTTLNAVEAANQGEMKSSFAEREYKSLKDIRFLMNEIGNEFEGNINDFSKNYIHITLDFGDINGFIEINTLRTDIYEISNDGTRINGRYSKNRYFLGQKLLLRLDRVDFMHQRSFFLIRKIIQ
mgnify:FL=1